MENNKQNTTQKKSYLGGCLIVVVLFAGIFLNSLFGNPVSNILCKNAAEKYIAENYPGFYIESYGWDFKSNNYYARIDKENTLDNRFWIDLNIFGSITDDSYDYYVTSKYNTKNRISGEYNNLVEAAFTDADYNIDLMGGSIMIEDGFALEDYPDAQLMPDEDVVLEKQYDYTQLGRKYGAVRLWIKDDEITYERAAEILLNVKERLEKAGIGARYVSMRLNKVIEVDGQQTVEEIQFEGMEYNDIYPDGLEERIKNAHEERMAYFAKLDAEMQLSIS